MEKSRDEFIAALYANACKQLLRTACRMLRDMELAQDLVHETFLLAIFQYQKLLDHPNPNAWLMQTLRNLIYNEQRLSYHQDIPLSEVPADMAGEAVHSLEELLPVQLNEDEKQLLIWRFELQMSHEEMARQLHISETACRQRLFRAVGKCGKYLLDP